ncbi:MAG TPA: hypothetical protein PKX56_07295 [Marmoricola sp.]|nr:hypothetical protein [Marmoricola sp.]HNI70481.1 hypothetical protein [Marmoricola sp.]HNJ79144.1 hypothetical protein [Marmoricola sp.]HNN47685.1 hypothetical protein [Marmoricola sp.]HNO39158.1 hypothetical protein [Marmoricola sp.]
MRRPLSLIAVAALVVGLSLTMSAPATLGGWSQGTSYSPADTRSDKFAQTVADASITPTLHVGDSDLNPATSTPGLQVGLTSDRLHGNLDVYSFDAFLMKNTSDSSATSTTSNNRLFTDSTVDVAVSTSADCSSGIQTPVAWTFGSNAVGNLASSNNYATTRGYTSVTGGNVTPGGTRVICPRVRSKFNTSTYNGRRDLVLASAGRNVGLRVKGRYRSPAAATWQTVFGGTFPVLKYTVTAPPLTSPGARPICRNSGALGAYGDLGFGWPTPAEDDRQQWTGTRSIYRFVIMRQNPSTGVWAEFKQSNNQSGSITYTAGGSGATGINSAKYRYYAGINSDHINNNDGDWFGTGAWVAFMWRGYLYSGDTTRYINSDFITYAREKSDAFQCGDGNGKPTVANTETGANAPGVHGIS